MRVLWTHNFNPAVPGSGSFMHRLASGVSALDVKIDLLYLGNLRHFGQIYSARDKIRRLSKNYDIVHAQFGSACAVATAAAVGPKVVSLRGSDWHRYKGTHAKEALHGAIAHAFTRLSLNSFEAVITMSDRMKDEVRRVWQGRLLETIPDPVDTSDFRPRDRGEARRSVFGFDDPSPWILFTTLHSSNPIKRTALAEEAVEIAAKTIPGLKLKIASGIPYEKMPLYVASCDIALCTSTHEGWPNSLKEALACGIPFVSTDVSDMSAIAARRHSCLVGPADPLELAKLIVEALSRTRDPTLHQEVNSMSIQACSQHLRDLYFNLLKTTGKLIL